MVLGDLLVKCKKQNPFGWLNGVFEVFDGVGVLGFWRDVLVGLKPPYRVAEMWVGWSKLGGW
jgi:hypothetical protein